MRRTRRDSEARRPSDERGVVTVLFALLLLVVMLITALVVDLSFVRNTRQTSKSIADASTAAAMQSLVTSDAKIYPWQAACAGLSYVWANDPEANFAITYMDGAEVVLTSNPCVTALTQQCIPNVKSSWAWIRAIDDERVVDIRAGYVLPDLNFPEDATTYSGDLGDTLRGGCDHAATIIRDVDDVYFGGVAGRTGYSTAVRSVGRAVIEGGDKTPPAFLLLERKECDVLNQLVGTGGGEGIAVDMPSATQPGRIHLDSSGRADAGPTACSGTTSGGRTVYSSLIGSTPGIRILGTATNRGQMTLRALNPEPEGRPTRAWDTPTGVCTTYVTSPAPATCLEAVPAAGPVIGREPVDTKYNPPPASGLSFMSAWHQQAVTDALRPTPPAPTATVTWRVVETSQCAGHTTDAADAAATHVFVNCPDGYSPNNAVFSAAREVIVNGPINLAASAILRMPAATRVVVGGTTAGGITTAGRSVFTINTTAVPSVDTYRSACAATDGPPLVVAPAVEDTTRAAATLTVFGGVPTGTSGAVIIGGVAAFCQTSVYIAGPKGTVSSPSSYAPLSSTDASYDPTCVDAPCPLGSALPASGLRLLSGSGPGASRLRWSAPNRRVTQPTPGTTSEDLALWSESGAGLLIQGELDVSGVVFLPNGPAQMQSPSDFSPRDAQFIARRLKLLSGSLLMKPTPANSVLIESLKSVGLVR